MKHRHTSRTVIGTLAGIGLLVIATSPFLTVVLIKRQASQIVNDTLVGLTSSGLANINISEGFVETALAIAAVDPAVRDMQVGHVAEMVRNTDTNL